jgi:O-methyltransferase
MDKNVVNQIMSFHNEMVDSSIINSNQIQKLVESLVEVVQNNIEGDVVEFGCYVGESSKYLRKSLDILGSDKLLYVYDSFEGLPPLSEYEKGTGWRPFTLKTTEQVLVNNFQKNGLVPPLITKGWFKDVPEDKLPNKIAFAFLDGDFYDSIYDSLSKIYDRMSDGGIIMFHDFKRSDLPGVDAAIRQFFSEKNIEYNLEEVVEQVGRHIVGGPVTKPKVTSKKEKLTLVTGLWDIKRDSLSDGWARGFDHYLNKFKELLSVDNDLIIFGDKELEEFVYQHRSHENTQFIHRPQEWFKNEFFSKIQSIRQTPDWKSQAGWLPESTQAKLEMYNPLVMSKMFLLNDAQILDKFDSDYLFWIDAGLTNTVHSGYYTHDKVFEKLPKFINKFSFVCFPYQAENEIHGFNYSKMNQIVGDKVELVARGGFFGGPKNTISDINTIYYNLLDSTLKNGLMGTEESLFSIMVYKHSDLVDYFEIESNGLFGKFFEDLKEERLEKKNKSKSISVSDDLDVENTALYVITFNSPKQFETLIKSMEIYDENFLLKPKKFLLNNSSDLSTTERYQELCNMYGFEHIKKDNLGICGGRQFIAEHADENGFDFHLFFEDDMFFYTKEGQVCKNGFNRVVKDLYAKTLEITKKYGYDFLKYNFTEFYGDNGIQWSWYNVPQNFREKRWPEKSQLPVQGQDPNAPRTLFKNIRTHKGLPFIDGEIYYCNWPQVVSKHGNKKMFLTEKWAHPFEQTWMSYIYQQTENGNINPAMLLLTPTEHDRFEFYDGKLRKES